MKRLLFMALACLGVSYFAQAQVPADALRFSSYDVLGTARTLGIGGGIGALGADFSVIGTNPAGIATFRRSEFSISPSFYINNTESDLDQANSAPTSESKLAFNLNNLGLVFARQGRNPNWRTANLAIGINRIATFQQTFRYVGESTGSYIDFFQEASIDLEPSQLNDFNTGLAFDVGALFEVGEPDLFYETDVELNENALLRKEQTVTRRGGINEISLAYAGNFKERLMIGFAIGFPILSYSEEKNYSEEDVADEVDFYRSLQFNEDLTTTGSGANLKLGFIWRISQAIRLGGAIHTPTTYTLTDDYETSIVYDFVDGNSEGPLEATSPESQFEYTFKTPWRFVGSAGIIVGRSGFISGEVEYLNYGGANFDLTENDGRQSTVDFEQGLNTDIANIYQSAVNIRLGGEIALDILRLRAGIQVTGTPYAASYVNDNPNLNGLGDTQQSISLGIGVREKNFFVDLGARFAQFDNTFEPYVVTDFYPQNTVSNSSRRSHLLLTFGYKF
ncbi:MAG: hypothetical protein AAF960_15355 [Bacteroidota bacterium]